MATHLSRELLVPYLDQRPYVQITSLLAVLSPFTNGFRRLSLRVGKIMTNNHLTLRGETAGDRVLSVAPCHCAWTDDRDQTRHLYVVETGAPVWAARVAYNEDGIVNGWRMENDEAVLPPSPIHTIYERIVALNKAYLQSIAPVGPDQQFLATRLDLSLSPSPENEIRLRHLRLTDGRHHASRIHLDGQPAGTIYFARHARVRAPT